VRWEKPIILHQQELAKWPWNVIVLAVVPVSSVLELPEKHIREMRILPCRNNSTHPIFRSYHSG
jgi:hypothetical protein